jgi:hypothetical protein
MDPIQQQSLNNINNQTYKALPYGADALKITAYDGNDNPLTVEYYKGGPNGKLLITVSLSYDGNGNLTGYTESR